MNKTISVEHLASKTCYIVVVDPADGNYFDFDDDTFKTLGSCTTPFQSLTDRGAAGVGLALYSTSLDLSAVHNQGDKKRVLIRAMDRLTGAEAPDTDQNIGSEQVDLQLGSESFTALVPVVDMTIDGADVSIVAWLESEHSELIDLDTIDSAATCDVVLWENTAGAGVFQVDDADDAAFALSANVDNHFELEKLAVITSGHDDKQFYIRVTIVENGNTHSADYPASVFGG